jgi:hypothetical protein
VKTPELAPAEPLYSARMHMIVPYADPGRWIVATLLSSHIEMDLEGLHFIGFSNPPMAGHVHRVFYTRDVVASFEELQRVSERAFDPSER